MQFYPSAFMTETVVTRVRGGYMNRWWIRAEVVRPVRRILIDEASGRAFCHPDVLAELRRAVERKQPDDVARLLGGAK